MFFSLPSGEPSSRESSPPPGATNKEDIRTWFVPRTPNRVRAVGSPGATEFQLIRIRTPYIPQSPPNMVFLELEGADPSAPERYGLIGPQREFIVLVGFHRYWVTFRRRNDMFIRRDLRSATVGDEDGSQLQPTTELRCSFRSVAEQRSR